MGAELVEGRDTSLGVARITSQGQCNLFTLTHGTRGCSCSTPLTAWRMKREWTTSCPRLSCKNGEGVCLCRIVRSFLGDQSCFHLGIWKLAQQRQPSKIIEFYIFSIL